MVLFASFMTDVCIMFIFASIILGLAVKGMADFTAKVGGGDHRKGAGLLYTLYRIISGK